MKRANKKYRTPTTMLRGVKCNICGALGSHFSSACTQRITGVPVGMRDESAPSAPATTTTTLDDTYLDPAELDATIRKRPDVPSFLRCRACATLARDAVWCQCCDCFVCAECLGPPGATWMCPLCENTSVDNFHIIQAMRAVIVAWFQSVAQLIDPYSISSDEEDAPPVHKRNRHIC